MAGFKNRSRRSGFRPKVVHRVDLISRTRTGGSAPIEDLPPARPTEVPPPRVGGASGPRDLLVGGLVEAPPITLPDLEALRAEALEQIRRDVQKAGGGGSEEWRRRVELLERRLSKLAGQIEDREAELARLRARRADMDEGIASFVDGPAGISEEDLHAEAKRAMMRTMFEANQKLQSELRASRRAGGE